MKAIRSEHEDVVVLALRGDFDAYVSRPFLDEIERLREEGRSRIVLNMRRVRFVGSSALGALIRARRACREGAGDLILSELSAVVRQAIGLLGLEEVFAVHENDAEAVQALG
jgi:anti-sigma B factor antagonist